MSWESYSRLQVLDLSESSDDFVWKVVGWSILKDELNIVWHMMAHD